MSYKKIDLEEALKLIENSEKIYVRDLSDETNYYELCINYAPNINWNEIIHILNNRDLFKQVKKG